jgi:hypothetical protein
MMVSLVFGLFNDIVSTGSSSHCLKLTQLKVERMIYHKQHKKINFQNGMHKASVFLAKCNTLYASLQKQVSDYWS